MLSPEKLTVGERIRSARKRAGLSHDRLGEMVGTSRQHLIRLEKGIHQPRDGMLARIAEATGQPVSFFGLAEEEDEEADQLPDIDLLLRSYLRRLIREETSA